MVPHDAVLVHIADEATFLAIVSASVAMILHAISQLEFLPYQLSRQKAIEIDPFSAVQRPSLATESLLDSGFDQCQLKLYEVLTGH